MIKNMRDVMNGPGLFRSAQSEIVVLRTFITFTKTTDFNEKRAPINPQVTDIILP